MSLPDQSAGVPPTFSVKVSQVTPSWHRSSPPSTSGALRVPPAVPVPIHVSGVVALGLIVPEAGFEARALLSAGNTATNSAAIKVVAIKARRTLRAFQKNLTRVLNVE